MTVPHGELAVLGALAAAADGLAPDDVIAIARDAGVAAADARGAIATLLARGDVDRRGRLRLSRAGLDAFLQLHADLERALDPSAQRPEHEPAQSIPWLTTVQTHWIDALSFNYAVEPAALARLLPPALEPEVFKGSAWLQVLVSSLRDMRPQGAPALFGMNFYQISYRAAVRYRRADGSWHRGGYFTRSDTNNEVMRAIGNRLVEFRFHDFGLADMSMLREGDRLIVGVDCAGGRLVAVVPTRPLPGPPPGSAWTSLEDLHEPLVECYDALGVDTDESYVYILTIDRAPWNAVFVQPDEVYCEYFDTAGVLGGHGRLDSVLHIRECEYRWRPLRRDRLR